jgi:hypothetical protein
MTQNIKTIIISVAATLFTLFVLNHLLLLFIVAWFAMGYYATSAYNREWKRLFEENGDKMIRIILFIAGPIGLVVSSMVSWETIKSDMLFLFKKALGNKTVKFQSPVVITSEE